MGGALHGNGQCERPGLLEVSRWRFIPQTCPPKGLLGFLAMSQQFKPVQVQNKAVPIATFHAQNTPQLGLTLSGRVCQPLGPGSPGSCINCFEHEIIYGLTNSAFGLALVLIF